MQDQARVINTIPDAFMLRLRGFFYRFLDFAHMDTFRAYGDPFSYAVNYRFYLLQIRFEFTRRDTGYLLPDAAFPFSHTSPADTAPER